MWADAIGGERSELVVLRCTRADAMAEQAARNRRERELLARHAMAWSGLAKLARAARFRRGFVDAIEVDARVWIERGPRILELAPLLSAVTLTGLHPRRHELDTAPAWLAAALDAPATWAVRGLAVIEPVRDAAALVARIVPRLHALALPCGLDELADNQLERLWLDGTLAPAVLPQLTRLRSLDAWIADVAALARLPHLTELCLRGATQPMLAELATTTLATRLERQVLDPADRPALAVAPLRRFANLRALELRGELAPATADALAELPLPALRELRLGGTSPRLVERFAGLEVFEAAGEAREAQRLFVGPSTGVYAHPGSLRHSAPVGPACLVLETGKDAGLVWELARFGADVLVGRATSSHVVLSMDSVARGHARLVWLDDRHWGEDRRSTNGTLVDGVQVDDAPLYDGAQLTIGQAWLRYFVGPDAQARAFAWAERLATIEPITGLPRVAPEWAARIDIANRAALAAALGPLGFERVFFEVARRLVATGATAACVGPGTFAVWPYADAARVVAAIGGSVDYEDEPVAIELRIG